MNAGRQSSVTDNLSEIAGKLTDAQREALKALEPDIYQTARECKRTPQSLAALLDVGPPENAITPTMLAARFFIEPPTKAYGYRLTPLGQRVREKLEQS